MAVKEEIPEAIKEAEKVIGRVLKKKAKGDKTERLEKVKKWFSRRQKVGTAHEEALKTEVGKAHEEALKEVKPRGDLQRSLKKAKAGQPVTQAERMAKVPQVKEATKKARKSRALLKKWREEVQKGIPPPPKIGGTPAGAGAKGALKGIGKGLGKWKGIGKGAGKGLRVAGKGAGKVLIPLAFVMAFVMAATAVINPDFYCNEGYLEASFAFVTNSAGGENFYDVTCEAPRREAARKVVAEEANKLGDQLAKEGRKEAEKSRLPTQPAPKEEIDKFATLTFLQTQGDIAQGQEFFLWFEVTKDGKTVNKAIPAKWEFKEKPVERREEAPITGQEVEAAPPGGRRPTEADKKDLDNLCKNLPGDASAAMKEQCGKYLKAREEELKHAGAGAPGALAGGAGAAPGAEEEKPEEKPTVEAPAAEEQPGPIDRLFRTLTGGERAPIFTGGVQKYGTTTVSQTEALGGNIETLRAAAETYVGPVSGGPDALPAVSSIMADVGGAGTGGYTANVCEKVDAANNDCTGESLPLENVNGELTAKLGESLAPGEEKEVLFKNSEGEPVKVVKLQSPTEEEFDQFFEQQLAARERRPSRAVPILIGTLVLLGGILGYLYYRHKKLKGRQAEQVVA